MKPTARIFCAMAVGPEHGVRPCAVAMCVAASVAFVVCLPTRAAELAIISVDGDGRPLPSRVLVRPPGGDCVVPGGAVDIKIGADRWFMSPGRSVVDVPEGDVLVRAEHGPEFLRFKSTVRVAASGGTVTAGLARWVNLHDLGYRCAENHIHVDSSSLGPMLVCEGLDFGSSLTWWNGPDAARPVPDGEGAQRLLEFAGRTVAASIFDAELERDWGAVYLQNLPAPLSDADRADQPNLETLQGAIRLGALVHYQAGWSREVAVDALLGCVSTVNVCNNNFQLHRFQPRSRYSNLLNVPGFPTYPDTDVGMMAMNLESYYRLLNWGLRLAAGAGSACGVKEVPVGYNRACVRVPADASLAEFNRAWAAGRNFVTNGPVLEVETESGRRPGDEVDLPAAGGSITFGIKARTGDLTLTAVELVVNGRVAATVPLTDDHGAIGEVTIRFDRGSWVAARCTARDDLLSDAELAAYEPDRAGTNYVALPSRLRFAHTSPIYVNVGGRHAAEPAAIAEGFALLHGFAAFAAVHAGAEHRARILAATEEARGRLAALRDQATGSEGNE